MNDMTVIPEVWPVAADKQGLWLLSGDGPWQATLPVQADGDVHAEIELLVQMHGLDLSDVPLLHSTSWRPNGTSIVLTYLAVVRRPGPVLENWIDAKPVSPHLLAFTGNPPPHGAAEAPIPRESDVLYHALRHAAFLRDTDTETAAVFDEHWLRHLEKLRPALAGMYRTDDKEHRRAA